MTIKNPATVKACLRAKGDLEGMRMARVYEYVSIFDGKAQFAMFNDARFDDMHLSEYVRDVVLLLEDGRLTKAGKEFLSRT